jgi:hypothetical protein
VRSSSRTKSSIAPRAPSAARRRTSCCCGVRRFHASLSAKKTYGRGQIGASATVYLAVLKYRLPLVDPGWASRPSSPLIEPPDEIGTTVAPSARSDAVCTGDSITPIFKPAKSLGPCTSRLSCR